MSVIQCLGKRGSRVSGACSPASLSEVRSFGSVRDPASKNKIVSDRGKHPMMISDCYESQHVYMYHTNTHAHAHTYTHTKRKGEEGERKKSKKQFRP